MTVVDAMTGTTVASADREALAAVLCGSFHRDREGLQATHATLSRLFHLLSPRDVDFIDPTAEFVRLRDEAHDDAVEIEQRHLAALRSADFMWLHAPDGYVGASAAMEIGEATAVGIPVLCSTPPADPILASRVVVVSAPELVSSEVLGECSGLGQGLDRLQRYYGTVARRRGWADESARDTLLLLTEELGELARAVRKLEGMARHQPDSVADVGGELADVQLYLLHLANGLGLDLSVAVTAKERVNASRFEQSRVA